VAEVGGERLPQRHELPVRVPVEGTGRLGHGTLDVGDHPGRRRVGVLVDVQEHRDVELRGAVGPDAAQVAARVTNAGAVFVGPFAPVSLGDYCAGSNHVLPTAGCACHSSGLSVRSFLKAVHVVDYSREALAEVADHVVTLARAEDLPGHGEAVKVRFRR
jgi:hypothetical protein